MASFQLLQQLPEELLQDILERIDHDSLGRLTLVSRWCYNKASVLKWREVELVDCRTQHEDSLGVDEHDDTALIKKLLILATNPHIARCVQQLAHRCHLPPPAIFNELPRATFSAQTLSTDPRTIELVKIAAQHMTNVHTLRIIFGHPNLNDALLRCFFDKQRQRDAPIRKLWLENCRISAGCQLSMDTAYSYGLPTGLDFQGLESVRLRRLPLRPGQALDSVVPLYQHVYARSHEVWEFQDGVGGQYHTSVNQLRDEQSAGPKTLAEFKERASQGAATLDPLSPLVKVFSPAFDFDDRIYETLMTEAPAGALSLLAPAPHTYQLRAHFSYRGPALDPLGLCEPQHTDSSYQVWQRERMPSADVAISLLGNTCRTLVSLNLDWIMTVPSALSYTKDKSVQRSWANISRDLFEIRFPHLRAFQLRNAVVVDTLLTPCLYLLDHSFRQAVDGANPDEQVDLALDAVEMERLDLVCLEWMEAHPNLTCLAWPMDRFFSARPMEVDIAGRVDAVIENLGRTLIDLRVDALYSGVGELQSENRESPSWQARDRRRRFIEIFASRMTKLRSIKIEGGIPRDERREMIRALHACPLEKIVMIGVCSPLGNTWGAEGIDLDERLSHDELEALEGEHKDSIWQLGLKDPQAPKADSKFEACFGWPPGPPMASILASYHADTVTELKFCGYKGAPVLLSPTPVTTPMLSALRHFHSLEMLIISLWLSTGFEGEPRDPDIISYWLNARSPSSTALVRITDEDPEGWEKELRTKYAPDALAWRITNFLGPFISETAKARKGGMHVRASFCVGDWGGIFDIDVTIGKGAMGSDVCLGFKGPREELEPERRRSKLRTRRWF